MLQETRWWLIRHAPARAPRGVILGQLDVAADLGDGSAAALLAACLPADAAWLTSPLTRARQTAAALAPAGSPVMAEPAFMEQHFGDWQGMSHDEVAARWPDEAAAFWRAPMRNAPPGGESFAAVMDRVGAALARHAAALAGRDIVLTAHDGTIRAALCLALGCPPEAGQSFRIDHLSLTCIDHFALPAGDAAWRVSGVNRAA